MKDAFEGASRLSVRTLICIEKAMRVQGYIDEQSVLIAVSAVAYPGFLFLEDRKGLGDTPRPPAEGAALSALPQSRRNHEALVPAGNISLLEREGSRTRSPANT